MKSRCWICSSEIPSHTALAVLLLSCGTLAPLLILYGRLGGKVPKWTPDILMLAVWPVLVIGVSVDMLAVLVGFWLLVLM